MVASTLNRRPRHEPAPHLRGWVIEGLTSIERLADAWDLGRVDEIDRIRAIWTLRGLIHAKRADGADIAGEEFLLRRLDPAGAVPPAPGIATLRSMVEMRYRAGPRGELHRLAIHAGLHRNDLSRFRHRGNLAADKVERLAAAILAMPSVTAGRAA